MFLYDFPMNEGIVLDNHSMIMIIILLFIIIIFLFRSSYFLRAHNSVVPFMPRASFMCLFLF